MVNLTTVTSTRTHKIKTIEVKYSNMTFVVRAYTHFIKTVYNSGRATTKYSATIKENGEVIGGYGSRKLIKAQMELINSKPHLFL